MQEDGSKKASGRRKFLVVFGIVFVAIGVFLAAFGLSFKIMMLPKIDPNAPDSPEAQVERLKEENSRLEEDIRRLKEQNDILINGGSASTMTSSTAD